MLLPLYDYHPLRDYYLGSGLSQRYFIDLEFLTRSLLLTT